MRNLLRHTLLRALLLTLAFAPSALAWPPLFGPEFTFTNPEITELGNKNPTVPKNDLNLAKLDEWRKLLEERCQVRKDCTVERFTDKHGPAYKVRFKDGWYYNISIDTAALEVQTKASTLEEFRARKDFLQKEIFETAKSLGIQPHERVGQGHIHLGVAASFDNDPQLFRNFIVDYSNRPELAWGALGNHLGNSPPIAALKPEQREAFAKVVDQFDSIPGSIKEFARAIESKVYTAGTVKEWGGPTHYQALRLGRVTWAPSSGEETLEIRGFRPQRNAEEYVRQLELLEARLKYLKSLKGPIPFLNPPTHELPPKEVVARFHAYVTEAGLEWERYRTLLPPKLASVPLDKKIVARLAAEKAERQVASQKSLGFDEIRDASGKLRERYRGIYEIYESMSPKEKKYFEEITEIESSGNRRLLPLPRILSMEERTTIQKGVEQRAKALRLLAEDVAKGDFSRIESMGLPRSVVEGALERSQETKWVQELTKDNIVFPYGPDLVRGPDGKFYVIEDNTGFVGGLGDSSFSREQMLRHMPQFKPYLEQDKGRAAVEIMVDHFRKLATPKDGAIVMLVHPTYVKNNATLSNQLKALGVEVVSDFKNLRVFDDGVYLRAKGNEWKRVGLLMPKNVALDYFMENAVPGLKGVVASGKVALGYRPGLGFLGDKEITPYVEKLVRGYLGQEPILSTPETSSFAHAGDNGASILDRPLLEKVRADRNSFVIKKADGLGGSGVWIGSKSKEKDWSELLKNVEKNPRDYIVQKFTPLSELEGHIVDMRPVTFVSRHGADVADFFWARALPVDGNGKVNVSIDGKVTAVFTTDPKLYPKGETPKVPVSAAGARAVASQGFCSKFFGSIAERFRSLRP